MDGSAAVAAGGDGDPWLEPWFDAFDLDPRMGIRKIFEEISKILKQFR
jgi:hypothetical protein